MQGQFPQAFGPYELLRSLGRGGMAEVFLAQASSQQGDKRLVALKRMHAGVSEDNGAVEMLIAEARLMLRFIHPNIAAVFDLGCHESAYYFLMEYVDGIDVGSLQNMLDVMGKPMDRRAVARIAVGVARGLDHAHELRDETGRKLGIVHRDVSPQNVLVNREGEVKLIDFGVAKVATRVQQTMAGIIKGKYAYMSPEQASADPVDARSDVFSLGVCMHELLTGKALFRGPNMGSPFAILRAVREEPIALAHNVTPAVGPELSAICHKALERDLDARYASAKALADDLEAWLEASAPKFDDAALAEYTNSVITSAPAELVPQTTLATPQVARMTGSEFAPSNLSVVARSPFEDQTLAPGKRAVSGQPPPGRARLPNRGASQRRQASSHIQAARAAPPAHAAPPARARPPSGHGQPIARPPTPVPQISDVARHLTPMGELAPPPVSGRPSRRAVTQFLWVGLIALVFAIGWSVIATLKSMGKI